MNAWHRGRWPQLDAIRRSIPRTSALGPISDLRAVQNISAFPVRADIGGQALQVRLVPGTDIAASLDHLISALLKIERHVQPKRPGGL